MTHELLSGIKLVLSDVDGTLVTPTKEVTPEAMAAIDALRAEGILFALASSRPVRGMQKVRDAVQLDTPVSGFNGGRIVSPEGDVIENLRFPETAAAEVVALLAEMGLSAWVFSGDDWFIDNPDGPRVGNETRSIGYDPLIVPAFDAEALAGTNKIVGISMDYPLVERAEAEINARFGTRLSATRSQPFYLDITHYDANKGQVVRRLAQHYGIGTHEIATIGDSDNDVMMFRVSGYSFAMGNGADAVKVEAKDVTLSNKENGFAAAMQRILDTRR